MKAKPLDYNLLNDKKILLRRNYKIANKLSFINNLSSIIFCLYKNLDSGCVDYYCQHMLIIYKEIIKKILKRKTTNKNLLSAL